MSGGGVLGGRSGGGGGGGGVESGWGTTKGLLPTVAHPGFLEAEFELSRVTLLETVAQPLFFGNSAGVPSISILLTASVVVTGVSDVDANALGILMPFAAAIFRSSFSSRLRSFSFRLSISTWGLIRLFACMSLKRALW